MSQEENVEMNDTENVREEEGVEELTEHVEEEVVEGEEEEAEVTHENDESAEKEAEEEEAEEEKEEEEATKEGGGEEEEAEKDGEEIVASENEEKEGDEEAEAEEEEEHEKTAKSDDEEFAGFGEEEINTSKKLKKRQVLSSDDDAESDASVEKNDGDDNDEVKPKKKKHKSSHRRHHHKKHSKKTNGKSGDAENDDEAKDSNAEEEDGGGGDEEEEAGVDDAEEVAQELDEIEQAQKSEENNSSIDDKEEEEDEERPRKKEKEETDLQAVLNAQKAESKKRRRKNVDSEELNEMDNKIQAIINEMKQVAAEDRAANEKSLTTLQKIKMLPTVMTMLQKSDYHATMIEMGVLGAIAEWLAPLPDRSLPNIKIRTFLIDTLRDFGEINVDYLKSSGVGKAVMFLFKHPKEVKENKRKLEKLINNWSRPIFSLDGNFKQLTKEERQERDLEHVQQIKRLNSSDTTNVDEILNAPDKSRHAKKSKAKEDQGDKSGSEEANKHFRPGEIGFCPRARVPIPSSKDYVVRPKSNLENMENAVTNKPKKSESRLDKHTKRFIELKRNAKTSRAVTISVSK